MKSRSFSALSRAAVPIIAAVMLVSFQSTAALATSPAVVYSASDSYVSYLGPYDGNFHTVRTLHNLPAGTWMVVFTGEIDERGSNVANVTGQTTCRIASGGSPIDSAIWNLTGQQDGRGRADIF